jgi:hypothetical protein
MQAKDPLNALEEGLPSSLPSPRNAAPLSPDSAVASSRSNSVTGASEGFWFAEASCAQSQGADYHGQPNSTTTTTTTLDLAICSRLFRSFTL